jgi:transposase
VRVLRDYTRLRADLIHDRTRHWQRLEKLLEDALIKVSSVASKLDTMSTRDMIEALIAGQRDPRVLAGLARGRMRAKHDDLVEALTGAFDTHHGELARILLDQIDTLNRQIDQLTTRIEALITTIPAAAAPTTAGAGDSDHPSDNDDTGTGDGPALTAVQRLAEIPGLGETGAQTILAEIGLDMTRFPTAEHLTSWARLCPRTIQSGSKNTTGKTGKGNPYLKATLGNAAATAARTHTFLGERYRRIVKRRGKLKAAVAVARSTLVIIWHLLTDPTTRYHDLGSDYHDQHIDKQRRTRSHIQQLQALGYTVTLTAA